MGNFSTRIKNFIQTTDSRLLVFAPIVLGVVIVFIIAPWFVASVQDNQQPIETMKIAFIVGTFCMALSGLMQVIKKEVPIRPSSSASIQGKSAVIIGIFWILFWGSLGIGLAIF